jgi:hypothetical protein
MPDVVPPVRIPPLPPGALKTLHKSVRLRVAHPLPTYPKMGLASAISTVAGVRVAVATLNSNGTMRHAMLRTSVARQRRKVEAGRLTQRSCKLAVRHEIIHAVELP